MLRLVPRGAMTVAETLRAARKLIKRGWTQGTYARDDSGHLVAVASPLAMRFCAVGAVLRVANDEKIPARIEALLALGGVFARPRVPGSVRWADIEDAIARWNDEAGRTVAHVLAAYDRAIKAEEAASEERR